ncbi:MAG: LytTR family DNA-binding domain-containing protein [Pseudomonadota bacterium]
MSIPALGGNLPVPRLKPDPRGFGFFLLVPLALAIMTATTTGYSRTLGYGGALAYVSLLSIVPWWIGEGTTRAAWYALRRFQPPLWLLCKLGILLACVFVGPYTALVTEAFSSHWPGAAFERELASGGGSAVAENVMQILRATFFWVTANYAFDRFFDYPRFRYDGRARFALQEPTDLLQADHKPVELLQRLTKIDTLSDILYLKAEQHYVRVAGQNGDELVAYRFGDAVRDMDQHDGFRVHRSYWVSRCAVLGIKEAGSKLSLEMSDGTIVPVSGPYRALVRQVF